MRSLAALGALLIVLLAASWAGADDQRELLARARAAEDAFEPGRALALYREAEAVAPGSRLARRAKSRIAWLSARSDGDWRPLAELMRVRALKTAARDRIVLTRFAERIASLPDGRVRIESLEVLADGYLQLGDDSAALPLYAQLLASDQLSDAERQLAISKAAMAKARLGRGAESERDLEQAGLGDKPEAVYLRAERLGRAGAWLAGALLAFFLGGSLFSGGARGFVAGALAEALAPRRIVLGAYVLALPLLMVWLYDWRLLPQVAAVLGACAALVATSAVLGAGLRRAQVSERRLSLLAALGAASTLGVAFVAAHRVRLLYDILIAWEQAP